jgi:DNA-binding winged helix-turn-helix (wHTH) protein
LKFSFSQFEVDDQRFQLLRSGRPVAIEPKALRMLILLVQRHPATVSRRELLATVWSDVTVTDAALRRAASTLRKALGDDPGGDAILQTVRGRGYRIGVDVTRDEERDASDVDEAGGVGRDAFIGREAELADLNDALADARAGRGRVVLLVGEPGIGKTRMAEELAASATRSGFETLWGRCLETQGAPALWPWIQILRRMVRSRDVHELRMALADTGEPLARLMPELVEAGVDERVGAAPLAEPGLDAARFELFEAVADFLRMASQGRPILIVIDDLHQADADSIRLLMHLAGALRSSRILLVGTYRNVARRTLPDFDAAMAEIERLAMDDVLMSLGPLTEGQVRSLAEQHSRDLLTEDDVAEITERTGGNPFFVRELARWLRATESAHGAIPRSVRGMIRARLDRIGETTRDLLEVAAVIGRHIRASWIAGILGNTEQEVIVAVEEAEAAGFLQPDPRDRLAFQFTHALVMEAIYELLPRARRAEIHLAVAEAMERAEEAVPDANLAALAHHFGQAVGPRSLSRSVEYGLRAAERAERLLAFEDALDHYRRVERALDEPTVADPARRCEVLLAIARLEESTGNRIAQIDACTEVALIARRLDRPDLFARAALAYQANSMVFGRVYDEAIALLEEAIERLGPEDSTVRARLLAALADQLAFSDLDRRARLRSEARRIAEACEDDRLVFEMSAEERDMDEWVALADKRLEQARRLDTDVYFKALLNRGTVRLYAGDVAGCRMDYRAVDAIAKDVPGWAARYWPAMGRSALAALAGRLGEGERYSRQALEIGRAANREHLAHFGGQITTIRFLRGTLHRGPRFEEEAALNADPLARAFLMMTYMCEGDRDAVRASFERLASADFRDVPRRPLFVDEHWEFGWPSTICILADAAAFLEDANRAAILYELMTPHADRHAVLGDYVASYLGGFDLRLGKLAMLLGEHAAADAHLERSLEWATRSGARPWQAYALLERVRLARARGREGDVARAEADGERAVALAQEIGMAGLERDLEALGARR